MKHSSLNKKNIFFTEVDEQTRSQTTTSKRNMNTNKSKLYSNDRPKTEQTGHINPSQIKSSKIGVLDYMITKETQFANLESIEEFFIENSNENNKKYASLNLQIQKKKEQLKSLDDLIREVNNFNYYK